jgi:hypothetical protein
MMPSELPASIAASPIERNFATNIEMNVCPTFARSSGLALFAACAEFDLLIAPSEQSPRMQYVLDRR